MKTLNTINYDDLYSGCGVTCKYKGFIVSIHNGYYTIEYNKQEIDCGCLYSNTIGEIKKELKNEVNHHDIKALCNMSINTLKNGFGFKTKDIEKIDSYVNIKYYNACKNDKKLEKYLLNEIKEYFIFRLVRD